MNIYVICTLWTTFQAERDWQNSYRRIVKFHSNIYSIFFAYSTSLLFIITNTHSIGTVKHTWRFHPLDTVLLIFYIFDSFLITYLFSVIIYKKIVSLHIKIWFTIFFGLAVFFSDQLKKIYSIIIFDIVCWLSYIHSYVVNMIL